MAHGEHGRRMKIGANTLLGETTLNGRTPRFNDIKEMVLAAEAVGFDSFWLPDHLLVRTSDGEEIGCWEVFTFLSALASVTSRITLGPFVAANTFRNPALLAKMADALDEISGGRVILGFGAANFESEHTAFGFPFDHRAARFEEAVNIIRSLLRDGHVDFHGRYYDVRDCAMRPRGPSPSGPPIWSGARGERMLHLIAQYADAYIMIWPHSADEVRVGWEKMVAICDEVGRDPATLDLVIGTHVHLPEDGQPAQDDRAITGGYDEIAEQLNAMADAGVSHAVVVFRPATSIETVEQFGRVLEILDRG